MKHAIHNLTHTKKLSCDQGLMVPLTVMECLPADVMDHSTACLIRTQPLVAPVMHEVDAKIHHWYVPTRTLWKNFPLFITGGPDGADDTVPPYITTPATTGFAVGSTADYLGVTPGVPDRKVSALPFRAMAQIYNNYYRDQDLQPEVAVSDGDGADTTTYTGLYYGCWEKDYFTSARPAPQKGPSVSIPLSGNAPVVPVDGTQALRLREPGDPTAFANLVQNSNALATGNKTGTWATSSTVTIADDTLEADLSDVNAVDIEDLRLAAALQRYQENMSRYGSRYVERIMSAFGIRPRSLELDLPQYIGGGQQKVSISEVLATAEGEDLDVGDMKGHGITAMKSNRYRFPVAEHGYIISILIVRPRTQYVQGLNKLWSRDTKEDFYQPELAYLGQQPILNKEIYLAHPQPDGVFGYQDAYDSYRYMESTVAGEFRDTLDFWHMARKFASPPALNGDFVKANPTDRIYAIPAADQLYVMAKHRVTAKRRVIKVAKPKLF